MAKLDVIIREPRQQPAEYSVIWLHGLGADAHDFEPIIPQLNLPDEHRVRFIFPHAPFRQVTINNGMTMRAWYDIYELDNLDREDRQGLDDSQQAIAALVKKECDAGIASEKIFLAGFSQGGALALYSGLRYPKRLGGILALSTYLPLMQQIYKELTVENEKIHIFLGHGQYDQIIPIVAALSTRDHLHTWGYQVEWHAYDMAHEVSLQELHDISSWFKQRLQK